jgi:hypothetical protein
VGGGEAQASFYRAERVEEGAAEAVGGEAWAAAINGSGPEWGGGNERGGEAARGCAGAH